MWKNINGRLIQQTDESRVKFRTNISKSLLDSLSQIAKEHDTCINYLIESGLNRVLEEDYISFDKKTRPKDRVQYKTTYDKQLINRTKKFAAENGLFINDVIEYSCRFIEPSKSKPAVFRYRIEQQQGRK